ncbi:replicative DNA helicase [Patescibacteria group bacterium]|nr:replicative DNA helicase [Patescibacteria group bacterium]
MVKNTGRKVSGLRVPPQNIDLEKALLGSIMIKPDVMNEITDIISVDSFYAPKHRIIYDAMLSLFSKNEPIDLLSLSTRLKQKKQLDQAGGSSFLAELVNAVPSASNVKHYAEVVQKMAMMRNLISAADYISELGYDEAQEIEDLLDRAEKKIYEVTESPSLHKFVSLSETLTEAWDRFETLNASGDGIRGIRTGFSGLDNILSGFQKSDLIILAARPSMGKTALALDIARQSAIHHGTTVGIFSLEMSEQQLVDRMLSAQSRVDAWKLRTGKNIKEEEYEMIRNAMNDLSKAPIYIDDKPGNTVMNMRTVARRLKRERGLDLIIVDYLQMMSPQSSRAQESLVQQITEISRSLKNLARELDIPVLALSQLSRAIEQRRGKPRLSDLRDSGSIEQDADVVMFIHRDDKYNEASEKPNIAEILIEKHRNGPTGYVELYFNQDKVTFQSMEKSSLDDSNAVAQEVTDDF